MGFEDEFRGSETNIEHGCATMCRCSPAPSPTVVDLGCGRGEFLRLLEAQGIAARGVDVNDEMIAAARAHGLDAVHGDALAFLASIPDESLGGLIATQVIEHLEPAYLMRLLQAARRALGPGADRGRDDQSGLLAAFFSSYIRD